MPALSLVFAGSPAVAVPSLVALHASGHRIAAVVTREDSAQGRRRTVTPTAVADAAGALGLPAIKANRLTGSATEQISELNADLGVIVAYGGLVREPLLSAPRLGWINLHFSLLPRWRGAAPVQHAIMAGDDLTGASVFRLVEELDAGDVYGQLTQSIGAHETSGELLDSLAEAGAELLLRVVDAIADGTARAEAQQGDVTLAPKLTLDDGRIDWAADVGTIDRLIRGVTPEPGAFTTIDGARFKVLRAAPAQSAAPLQPGALAAEGRSVLVGTGTSPLELFTVQPAGKKPMPAIDWWRGRSAKSGSVAE
ncbi:methionyl-tRNA formyltransferase [Parafrigoribacterium soli]|uniref:methionyl-tRNA formyltransferase n=1 Tax=Parafrigoribacterium soli TaxID=3144663 RepID=UPI0032EAF46C